MEMTTGASIHGGYQDYYEDDAFYVELKRQILRLTSDDDIAEDRQEGKFLNNVGAASFNRWSENGNHVWRASACEGTGVFIPPAKSRRRNKPRMKNEKRRMYKAVENRPKE